MKTLVIIPTYNEIENISNIIDAVLKQRESIDVLIVDDNSPDGTSNIVKEKQKKNKRINLLEREGKMGLGSAYVAGFKYALENNYDYIMEMDADFSHDPNDIPRILNEMENADLVIGSRYLKGIHVVNWPLRRLFLSFFAAQYAKIITRMKINDPTGGFKCFRKEVLASIDLDDILSDGYSFQIEMNFRTWVKKFRIKELSIVFTDRRVGQSKMSKKIVREAIIVVWKLKYYQLKKRIK
ncbi:MAG: polyprenol monophosphomannose synthase [Candidatus Tenebribacter burtonii]|jgi:dolichol-phosphate mannosyltransferase|nr:polyprenol monophosphomannose synthase [Candidatus Tenebribacter burtonii]